jgi:vacuolar protein sorting-associated protein 33A
LVGGILNKNALRINELYESRKDRKSNREMREFVNMLPGLQEEHERLRIHTGVTEEVMRITGREDWGRGLEIQQSEFSCSYLIMELLNFWIDLVAGIEVNNQETGIRELINQEAPIEMVIRLLVIYNLISGGLRPKVLDELKREILQVFIPLAMMDFR